MSDTMKVALQITAVDMLSGVVQRAKQSILGLGGASRTIQRDFDVMERSVSRGLKSIAVSAYAVKKMVPGIRASADLQEAMLGVKANLAGAAKDAGALNDMLRQVKRTAVEVSADAPFSAEDVVRIENALIKAGLSLEDVTGKAGAAFSATALASLTGEAPEMIGDSLAAIGDQFKFKGADYGDFADWLVRVDDAGSAKVATLISGLKMAGSQAAALKISAKDAATALGALAPLGDRAGSSYNNFLLAITSKGRRLRRRGINLFEDGRFIGMQRAIDLLRKKFGQIENDEKRLKDLMKIFGEEGGRAANTFIDSAKGFKGIEASAERSLSMAEKMTIWGEGLNAALKKLGGTSTSTLANLFDPALKPLRKFIDLTNIAVGRIGKLAEENKFVSGAATYGLGGLAAAGGTYGIYSLIKGGMAGKRVLKGLGGFKGLFSGVGQTAVGIAKGKAVEAATGVQPVFVTNWPTGFDGGAGGLAGELAGMKKGRLGTIVKGLFRRGPGGLLGAGRGLAALRGGLTVGSAGVGTTAVAATGSALAGYGIGTLINKGLGALSGALSDGKYSGKGWLGEMIYDALHKDNTPELKNDIKINLHVDDQGRVTSETDNTRTNASLALELGAF